MAADPKTAIGIAWDSWRTYRRGAAAIAARQRARVAALIAHARSKSPIYGELYRGCAADASLSQLPVTSKKLLMERFDDWCIAPDVKLESARRFVEDPTRVGDYYLGRYTLLTTSGTTGARGLFLLDARTMRVTNAMALRMLSTHLSVSDVARLVRNGGGMAMVMAQGGHFASAVAAERLQKQLGARVTTLSVHQPISELVARLNAAQPALLAPYASTAALLATEQEAGRLHIAPILIALAAEGLPAAEYDRIARAFGSHVLNSYAATECPFLSFSCRAGWLHVNADWVAIEAVDAEYRPVAAGTPSHTVLITNLANRLQPLIRYDLGDSVVQQVHACACGSPLPSIRVQGRSSDVLRLRSADGTTIALPPLTFGVAADAVPGILQAQLVQVGADALRVRLRVSPDAAGAIAWGLLEAKLQRILSDNGLANVRLEKGDEAPALTPGGKYRAVIPMS